MKKKGIGTLMTAAFCLSQTSMVLAGFTNPGIVVSGVGGGVEDSILAILGVIQWIGFIVGIGMAIYIGIKYLTAGAGTKAEVKSTMIPWLVGALCVALAPTIASSIFTMFANTKGE